MNSHSLTLHVEGFLLCHLNYFFTFIPTAFQGTLLVWRGGRAQGTGMQTGLGHVWVGCQIPFSLGQKVRGKCTLWTNPHIQNQYFKLGRGLFYKSVKLYMCLSFSRKGQKQILPNQFLKVVTPKQRLGRIQSFLTPVKGSQSLFPSQTCIRKMVCHSTAVALYLSVFHYISISFYSSKI